MSIFSTPEVSKKEKIEEDREVYERWNVKKAKGKSAKERFEPLLSYFMTDDQ